MKKIVLIFVLLSIPLELWGACGGSTPTWTAASPGLSDIQDCLTEGTFQYGDTINIPAGTADWSGGTLTITKSAKLIGAGIDTTTINNNGRILYQPDSTTLSMDDGVNLIVFELSNMTIEDGDLFLDPNNTSNAAEGVYIHDIKFFQSDSPAIETDGQVYGVISDCQFVDITGNLMEPMGADSLPEWHNHYSTIQFGGSKNLYFEDNTISWTSNPVGSDPGWIEGGQGGRIAARYNTWNFANVTETGELWDTHGWQYWADCGDSRITGNMISEYYGNTILANNNVNVWLHHRSPNGLFFNNVMTGDGSVGWKITQYRDACESDVAANAYCVSSTYTSSEVDGFTTEISNTYQWNNELNGTREANSDTGWDSVGDPSVCGIDEDIDYWSWNDLCTGSSCSSGVGRGTSAPTGTCTIGVGFWVAATATTTVNSSIIQNGTLYKCASTDTWEVYYTPYTYPHPLRAETNPESKVSGNFSIGN